MRFHREHFGRTTVKSKSSKIASSTRKPGNFEDISKPSENIEFSDEDVDETKVVQKPIQLNKFKDYENEDEHRLPDTSLLEDYAKSKIINSKPQQNDLLKRNTQLKTKTEIQTTTTSTIIENNTNLSRHSKTEKDSSPKLSPIHRSSPRRETQPVSSHVSRRESAELRKPPSWSGEISSDSRLSMDTSQKMYQKRPRSVENIPWRYSRPTPSES